jgi:hypothetical protein|tara:strand:- start:1087 stop:1899 length:813 start_codon:yes stop_codon:yes gene_type:complete
MAKKTTKTVIEEVEEGTRESGEEIPKNDTELFAQQGLDTDGRTPLRSAGGTVTKKTVTREEDDLVDVIIGGEIFKVTQDVADAHAAEQEENRGGAVAPEPEPDPNEGETREADYSTAIFADPNAVLKEVGDNLEERIVKRITGAYQQDQARSIFWDDFYRDAPELKEEAHLVNMVLNTNFDAIKGLKGKSARKKLAELTQAEIIRLTNKQKGITSKVGATTTSLEGDTQPAMTPASEEDQATAAIPQTLNAAIRERNRVRRERSTTKQAS